MFALLSACAPVAAVALGLRPAVIGSDAMQPTFGDGDVVINELVPATALRPGDVVTYADGLRDGALVTERVVEVRAAGAALELVTKGDAGARVERSSIVPDQRVGRVVHHLPGVGRVAAVVTSPLTGGTAGVALIAGATLGARARRRRTRG